MFTDVVLPVLVARCAWRRGGLRTTDFLRGQYLHISTSDFKAELPYLFKRVNARMCEAVFHTELMKFAAADLEHTAVSFRLLFQVPTISLFPIIHG